MIDIYVYKIVYAFIVLFQTNKYSICIEMGSREVNDRTKFYVSSMIIKERACIFNIKNNQSFCVFYLWWKMF